MNKHIVRLAAVLVIAFGCGSAASGHETDQFSLPPGQQFVDWGPWFSQCHYRVLDEVVRETNKKIQAALASKDPDERERRLAYFHSPGMLADAYRAKYAPGFFDMSFFEARLKDDALKAEYPGEILLYEPFNWIYLYSIFPVDYRRIPLLFPAGTIECYGVYWGTDKVGHFHDLGHLYFKSYLSRRGQGESEEQAMREMIEEFSRGPISESMFVGNWATGVYSNADLFANYIGFKFYRNMTESVKLKGVWRPPLLVRDGEYWRLNDHVGPDTDFMAPFFSDHLNEALNPCVYEFEMRWGIANRLRDIGPNILAFYADENGHPRSRAWFDAKVQQTWTYYGEDYGHSRKHDNLVTIGNTCFSGESKEKSGPEIRSAAR